MVAGPRCDVYSFKARPAEGGVWNVIILQITDPHVKRIDEINKAMRYKNSSWLQNRIPKNTQISLEAPRAGLGSRSDQVMSK